MQWAAAGQVNMFTVLTQSVLVLAGGSWMDNIQWQGYEDGSPMGPSPELLLDMNDPRLTFEVLRGTDVEAYAHAAATVLPAMPKVDLQCTSSQVHCPWKQLGLNRHSVPRPHGPTTNMSTRTHQILRIAVVHVFASVKVWSHRKAVAAASESSHDPPV